MLAAAFDKKLHGACPERIRESMARSYLLTDFLTANESAVISGHAGSEDPRRTPDTSGNEEIQ